MQTVTKFSGSTSKATKSNKFDWTAIAPGKIYKAVQGTDYASAKGFLVSMTRFANETNHSVERFVAPDETSVEFRFTLNPSVDAVDTTVSE